MPEATQTRDHTELLTGHGLRPTRQRLAVLAALEQERDDATAQEIHARIGGHGRRIGLATVYRTLTALSERGVIDALMHRPGELCYRLCGGGHHHHLTCSECHRVVELDGCELEGWLGDLAEEHGFAISGHTVEVTGTCHACSRAGSAG